MRSALILSAFLLASCAATPTPAPSAPPAPTLGIFDQSADVGDVGAAGSTRFDPPAATYTVTGSGANMWSTTDAFQFVWKRTDGDLSIAADIALGDQSPNPHRKAGVIIRADLEPGAPYADVVVHGDGTTALQYRLERGGPSYLVEAPITHARRVRLELEGEYVYFGVAGEDGVTHRVGGSVRIHIPGPYYVGLATCAHERGVSETAVFSNVELKALHLPIIADTGYPARVESSLEILDVIGGRYGPGNRHIVRHFDGKIEAPNWSHDGQSLIYNGNGHLWRIPVTGGEPVEINTGPYTKLNNDHGLSRDGSQIVFSDNSNADGRSRIYIMPSAGSDNPRVAIQNEGFSYWHAWSPDNRTLIYVAIRNNRTYYELHAHNLRTGRERRLTTSPGTDDGPEYSPDGHTVWFNSERSGNMTLWRMRPDGSQQTQVTSDANYRDWFPHISPDGKWIAFVSFGLDVPANDHPPNRDVLIRLMPTDGSAPPRIVATLFGGQGTMNVPSWSPDSTQLAFVSYRLARESTN